mmetsp:Transcript_9899/g.32724  ORF Transcript_9899/g.32724 Transcript_9899/m.32724 type:complete len:223 (+) Transcript_9899:645-1313(+)
MHERGTAARHDAFLNRRERGVLGILDAQLPVLQLGFRRRADFDHGDAAAELGDSLRDLLRVVDGVGFRELLFELRDADVNLVSRRRVCDYGGGVVCDCYFPGVPEAVHGRGAGSEAEVAREERRAGDDGDVLQKRLASLAEPGGFNRGDVQDASDFVHHQCGEGFAGDVFGDDQKRVPAVLRNLFQNRDQVLNLVDFRIRDQNAAPLKLHGEFFVVVHELRA